MTDQLRYYQEKLETDGCARAGRVALLLQDDAIVAAGPGDLVTLGRALLERLGLPALALFEPSLPFYNFVIARCDHGDRIVPTDTETRTFLHDIPFVRSAELPDDPTSLLAGLLGRRKGVLIEGVGILTTGPVTLEQAYINASSLFHAVFVKYLLDRLTLVDWLPGERQTFTTFRQQWSLPQATPAPPLSDTTPADPATIYAEMARTGRETVRAHLVDSSFGNLSCRSGASLYISQTGASLDRLEGCIDPVPFDNATTCGITASSELLAHRLIYDRTGDGVILHGHPKFSIIMSMVCDEPGCTRRDCWQNCPHPRECRGTPIVPGEIGAGGLAEKVSPVIARTKRVIVFGHGVFTFGRSFHDAFTSLQQTEAACREEYFRRIGSNG